MIYNIVIGGNSIGLFREYEHKEAFTRACNSPLDVKMFRTNKSGQQIMIASKDSRGFQIKDTAGYRV